MDKEHAALKLSAVTSLFFALLGIGFYWLAQSEAILLDGFFSLIAFTLGLLTLKVARLVRRPDDERFHFGYAFFEPLLNTIKGLIILVLCAFALASAMSALFRGGRELSLGYAVLYSIVASLGGFLVAAVQKRAARRNASPLLEVDAKNWLIDGGISSGVALSFLVAWFIEGTAWSYVVPYVDPFLVVAIVVVMIRIPLTTIKDNLGELLQVAPEPTVQQEVRQRFDRAIKDYSFAKTYLRMVKIGRYFYLMIHILVPREFRLSGVKDLDAMRAHIANHMKGIRPNLILDTIFTADEAWATDSMDDVVRPS
jgi:cation diffusion facilitator family transporter